MTARAIDEVGVIVDFPTVTQWIANQADNTIHLYSDKEITAVVPGHWIVRILPLAEVDPGVEARE